MFGLCLLFAGLIGDANAKDLVLKSGKKFTGVVVLEVTNTHLKFKHDAGMSRVLKTDMDDSSATQFGVTLPNTHDKALADQLIAIKSRIVEVETRDGRKFYIKDLTSLEPNALKFTTASGSARVLFTEFPADTARLLGYDAASASVYEEKQKREQAKQAEIKRRFDFAESSVDSSKFEAKITPIQKLNGGWLCSVAEWRSITVTKVIGQTYNGLSQTTNTYVQNQEVDVSGPGETALVSGLSATTRTMQSQSSVVFNVGKYRYNSVGRGELEVPIFFLDRRTAVRHVMQQGLATVFDDDVTPSEPLGGAQSLKAYGTGFFVTPDGYLFTNNHVIEGATDIKIHHGGQTYNGKLAATDEQNDVAIVKVEPAEFPTLGVDTNRPAKLGDSVFTIGFPRPKTQGRNPKYTEGSISGLTGLEDATNQFQVSVPIQGGNSGGPLVSSDGKVVGVMVSTLNPLATLAKGSGLPQNVNYAVKIKYAVELARQRVSALATTFPDNPQAPTTVETSPPSKSSVIEKAEKAVALIEVQLEEKK